MPECSMEYLFTYTLDITPPEVIGELPDGARANFYIAGGTIDGPRVKGKARAVGADFLMLRRDGVAVLDVHATFETDVPDWLAWDASRHPKARIVAEEDGEVIGFDGARSIVMLFGSNEGLSPGTRVVSEQSAPTMPVSASPSCADESG